MTSTPQSDPAEVAKFDAIAHRFWDERGEFGPLHILNPVRLEFVASRTPLQGSRALDVGCGGGLLAEGLCRAGAAVLAIDLAPSMIEVAKLHAAAEGLQIDYRVAPADALAVTHAGGFDVVTCMEMLEHVPDPAGMVDSLARLVRPGGSVFVSTINRNLKSFLLAIVGAEYLARLLPPGTHEYERLIRPAELASWARGSGLDLLEIGGLAYNPVTSQARLVGDASVNYIVHLRKPGAQ